MIKLNLLLEKLKRINFLFPDSQKLDQNLWDCFSSLEPHKKPNLAYHIKKTHSSLVFLTLISVLTPLVGYRFYNQPKLGVDTIATETIVAPTDGVFEDQQTTEEKRREAKTGVVPVLKVDQKITEQIETNLANFTNQIDQIRRATGSIPFVSKNIISLETQLYLRACSDQEWSYLKSLIYQNNSYLPPEDRHKVKAFSELKNYQYGVSEGEFENLLTQIELARKLDQQGWSQYIQESSLELNPQEKTLLLSLTNQEWQDLQTHIFEISRGILTQGIPQGLPRKQLEASLDLYLHWRVENSLIPLARKIILANLKPNLTENTEETKARAEKAVEQVEPVLVSIRQGEIIVREGEAITQAQFVLLDGFNLSRRMINWKGLIISGIIVTTTTGLFCLILKKNRRSLRVRDYILLGLLSLTPPLMAIAKIPYTPLPVIGFLVSSFYNPTIAISQVLLSTGLVSWTVGSVTLDYLIAGAVGGLIAGAIAHRLRSREEQALLGVGVGLAQGLTHLILNLIPSAAIESIWTVVLMEAGLYGLAGVAWCILALGLSPYLERLFDLITPIRLAELCNPNRPLLKRLATEAPGTFQHTLFVASLGEAAARELHCNVELIRAGTLYHDIGKMHDPLGFIENQMGGPNKHDQIDDPWVSAQIIKKHVTQGLVMAKKYGLPKAIRDFIPEHQGTLLISYFYFKARERANFDHKTVLESDFRYDGPIPQSREAGIMMLADGSEAALRSMKDVNPEQALKTLKKIFKARWQDGQLVDSDLKWEELPIIANVFVQVWQQFNHQRIAYPKAALEPFSKS